MTGLFKFLIILVVAVYVLFLIFYLRKKIIQNKTADNIEKQKISPNAKKGIKLLSFEAKIVQSLNIQEEILGKLIFVERAAIILILGLSCFILGFIPLCIVIILIGSFIFSEMLAAVIENTGITYLENTNLFLDSYIPSINTGLSNDQAILKFIETNEEEELFEWWANKNNGYKPSKKWEKVAEIYEMMEFNESRGMDNSVKIIEEMQKDMDSKQKFYNDYLSRIGEIKPIELSYYIGSPLILFITFGETREWWFSLGGAISCIIIAIIFLIFQLLLYRVKKNTINTMF